MASENVTWGAGKIVGALKHLGIRRNKLTVLRIMKDNGFDPNPPNGSENKIKDWNSFLKTHFHLMVGADFLTKEVWTMRGIVRYLVFFVIDYKTRKVKIIDISHEFYGEKMEQFARNMTYFDDALLKDKKYFYCERQCRLH